jgi:ribosomal protein L16 Arg81 hydroxylase
LELSAEWRRWIAEHLLFGTPVNQIVAVVSEQTGVRPELAGRAVRRIGSTPVFAAADAVAQRLRKLESLLDVQAATRRLGRRAASVPRRGRLGGDRFLEDFYAANRPVLLRDFAESWPAVERWNPEYLRERFGDEQVEIMAGREGDARYEVNSEVHKRTVTFGEYIDMVTAASTSNDFYLVANNNLFDRPALRALLDDVEVDPAYLDPADTAGQVFLWFGPKGTITPLHHDLQNILFVQVYGAKRVTLVSPFASHRVYNDVSVFSEVDAEHPDYGRHPRFAEVSRLHVLVRPSEALFIPVGWWHRVEALDVAISVSFTNFAFPNAYEWQLPDIGG